MTFQGETRYTFVSDAKTEDTFLVVRFSGYEAISQPYRFEIELATEDEEIDLGAILKNQARFVIHRADMDDRVFNGMPAEFEQMEASSGHNIYKVVLVPRLWNAGLYHENQLFIKKSVKDIIKEVLQQTRLTGEDYVFRLTGTYNPWEYICQWRETDLNFIHRWMEREGIYYYFVQDGQKEKMVITDSLASHQNIIAEHGIPYSRPSATVPRHQEVIQSIMCRRHRLPNKVTLRDYNYRNPSLELKAEATVDAAGHGEVYFYGEHFKTPEEGGHLAHIRAQEFLCRENMYHGESTAANFSSGHLFEMQDHYRPDNNQQYLLVEVEHEGHQAIAGLSGQQQALKEGEEAMEYRNRFKAIPAGVQFRPEHSAERPKFFGTMNATVDAEGSGEYAEIDEQGRYKVILPFDRSGMSAGRASRWIRMAQPYAGNGYGMHFPLHRGTEVLVTFIDGDPDRPIIAASVPNPETCSPVTAGNFSKSMVRSASGNEYHLEDKKGSENIYTRAVKDQTSDVANDRSKNVGRNEKMQIGSNKSISVGENHDESIGSNKSISVGADHKEDIAANMNLNVGGDRTVAITAAENKNVGSNASKTIATDENKNVGGNASKTIGGSQSVGVGGSQSVTVGSAKTETISLAKMLSIGAAYQVSVGAAMNETVAGVRAEEVGISKTVLVGGSISVTAGTTLTEKAKTITLEADNEINIRTGKSLINMKKNGEISIKGDMIFVKGTGNVKIKGKKVLEN